MIVMNVANVKVSFVPIVLKRVTVLAGNVVTVAAMNVCYNYIKEGYRVAQNALKQLPLCWWTSVGDRMKK